MPWLGSAKFISLSLRRPRSSLRPFHFFHSSFIVTLTRWPTPRAFSIMADPRSNLFEYTTGHWVYNDAFRHAERRRVFNVDELSRLAAESVDRSPDDVVNLEKLAEGGLNRTFLITMRDGFQMVARIPYPSTIPKYFAVASEVATMALLRSSGLPIPDIYGYSPTSDNAAETEYIFMEFVEGINLGDIWFELGEDEVISILQQLAKLESKIMSIVFPAGGSLYYTKDLENVAGSASGLIGPITTLEDKRFCLGPEASARLWYGRRSQLDLNRGSYESAEAALQKGAEKELAYLRRFGRPLLPFHRERREAYQYQKQLPSDHMENLDRYLSIVSSLIPKDPALSHFCIRHPDLQPSNIFISKSPDSDLRVVGLIDWQHTSVLPMFLSAGIPNQIQNYSDPDSLSMKLPSLPEELENLDEHQQGEAIECYRRRLVHYHYVKNTKTYNERHFAALLNPIDILRRRLFTFASDPWEGETLALKVALIDAMKSWKTLTGGSIPCPLTFDPNDIDETMKLDEKQTRVDNTIKMFHDVAGFGPEGWVPAEYYEEALERNKSLKEAALSGCNSEEERAQVSAHWFMDDMDEEEYM